MLTLLFMGIFSLTFDIQPVEAPYPIIYIRADGSIDPSTANITSLDNVTYTFTADINAHIVVEKNNTVVDGAGYTLQGVGGGTGIDLTYTNNVTLQNVKVTNFTNGIYLYHSSNNTVIGNTASSNNGHGIYLNSSSNNTVIGNTVSSNGFDGIYLNSSTNNAVTGNTFSNNYYGIRLWYSSNNAIIGNTVSNNDFGIRLSSSSNNAIIGNTVSNNGNGIRLSGSSNNTVTGNTASNNEDGIRLYFSSNNNNVTANIASSNNIDGISLYYSSNNVLGGNTASNNTYGICLVSSSNNVLFHNNLINNTVQANVTTGYVNTWDDGVEGNYWSNYTGVDLDHDGIGDTEHVIGANNTDNYPLMGMFSDFKATSEYHVQTICNSSISNFQFNGTTISFNVSGGDGTIGFCRILIPTALMNATYKVFVNGTEVAHTLLPCSNSTHSYLYFTYNLSTQEVIIIPEFPSFLILPLFMAATLLAVIIIKRKHRANLRVPV
jgi:parallel beta-helix repeat protein